MGRNCPSVDFDAEKFHDLICEAIDQAGSQRELARQLNTSHTAVSDWYNRKSWPSPVKLKILLRYVYGWGGVKPLAAEKEYRDSDDWS
jgi:transcriptional regulator with XRE-family HTH domain